MLSEIFDKLNRPKTYLLAANFFLVIFLILFSNLGILPAKNLSDFIFFALIYLAFALYRPGWSFLFFVGTIMLEDINLAPNGFGLALRPYQFIGILTILAVVIKFFSRRLGFPLPKPKIWDALPIIFIVAGFVSAVFAPDRASSFRQSVIALSFVGLYFLTRIFLQNIEDIKRITPFFLSSSFIVMLYGIWQNARFQAGLSHFEVMPGRPNATFTEADWLGIYLVLLLAVIYAMIYYFSKISDDEVSPIYNLQFTISNKFSISKYQILKIASYGLLVTSYVALILTVSRSAWLGALVVTFVFLFIIFTKLKINPREWQWRKTVEIKIFILSALLTSFALVYFFHLTNFQLFNRAQSTASGLQNITVSCEQTVNLPENIKSVGELEPLGCRHINLEEIASEKTGGKFVTEIYRVDPNVSIRGQIYRKSWDEVKNHPLLGIGWGSISNILGTDERGAGLNSSNIFLEVWLGSGFIGLFAFLSFLGYIFTRGMIFFIRGKSAAEEALGIFFILGLAGLLIPNLFNAGIFLGFLWVFLGIINLEEIL